MESACFVCCETYNKSTRKEIKCNFDDCNFSACKSCVREYLTTTKNDPHCMGCKRGYTQKFIVENLNRSFNDTTFKKHRKSLLLDNELSRMPETMQAAENYKMCKNIDKNIHEQDEKLKEMKKQLLKLQQEKRELVHKKYKIMHGKNDKDERKQFIFPCPNNDCRGYLSTQYKCEICSMYTCPQCHELIGNVKNAPHICNPDSVATAEEIKKTSKGCPSCGVRIQKISGCDQMYCTECRVAFSWNTGKIVTGQIHNPHYYELMRQENGTATRNPQDVLCGGLINYNLFNARIRSRIIEVENTTYYDPTILTRLVNLHRTINHITNYELPLYRTAVRELSDNLNNRIKYLTNEISKEELADKVYRNDINRKKTHEVLQVYEIISVVGIENFATLSNSKERKQKFIEEINNLFNRFNNLIDYTNNELKIISMTYNKKVCCINKETYNTYTKKYSKNEISDHQSQAGSSNDPL